MTEKNEAAPNAQPMSSGKPRQRKKIGVIATVLIAVVAVAGIGLWTWHEQPSFCGAICHTPMDPYLVTYEQTADSKGVDKWGNDVEDTSALLAVSHKSRNETSCLDCHTPTLGQQMSEGAAWVSGNYEVTANSTYGVVIAEKSLSDLSEASGSAPEEFCLNAACHAREDGTAMTWDDLEKLTISYGERNPHSNEHGNSICSDCHKAHRASIMQCTECHGDVNVPDGWLTANEAKKLISKA